MQALQPDILSSGGCIETGHTRLQVCVSQHLPVSYEGRYRWVPEFYLGAKP